MAQGKARIRDALKTEYTDFADFCVSLDKLFISELLTSDFIAFRSKYGVSREYVTAIRNLLDNYDPDSEEQDAVSAVEIPMTHTMDSEETTPTGEEIVIPVVDKDATVDASDDHSQVAFESEEFAQWEDQDTSLGMISEEPTEEEPSLPFAQTLGIDAAAYSDISIRSLYLSVRSSNCLKRAQCKTVADILVKTPEEIREIRNLGAKSFNEIVEVVSSFVSDHEKRISETATNIPAVDETPIEERALDPKLAVAIEALLMKEEYSTEELSEHQVSLLENIKQSAETLGNELCLEAYCNPANAVRVYNTFYEYSLPFARYLSAIENIENKASRILASIKSRKAIPFIRVYSSRTGKAERLLSICSDETTIAHIPSLVDKHRNSDELTKLVSETGAFFDWVNFDIEAEIASIVEQLKTRISPKSDRAREVLLRRALGNTLEEIGATYGITRERVRQMENKAIGSFWYVYNHQEYDLIMLIYAKRDGDNVLYFDELKEELGDFASVLKQCERSMPNHKAHYYSKELDAIVVQDQDEEYKHDSDLVGRVNAAIEKLPSLIPIDDAEALIESTAEEHEIPIEVLQSEFNRSFNQSGVFYHKNRLTVVQICERVLKERFPFGFKVGDELEADRFRKTIAELFGERAANITSRALDAKIGSIGVLCDRGKYIHPSAVRFDRIILDEIDQYIADSPKTVLTYIELFEAFKERLSGTQISNHYFLQGVMKIFGAKENRPCQYYAFRDYITKDMNVSPADELDAFIRERGSVHKSEIFAEFPALNDLALGQVAARCPNVFNLDGGNYIHSSQFHIQEADYPFLRAYLTEATQELPVNIRKAFDECSVRFPEFMDRNALFSRALLFAALNYMFKDEFRFSKPYIARLGDVEVTNSSVILSLLEPYDEIEIDELMEMLDEQGIRYVSFGYLMQMIAPVFIRTDENTVMRRELTGVDDDVVNEALRILHDSVETNGFLASSKVTDFIWYPSIDVAWNFYLLEAIVTSDDRIDYIAYTSNRSHGELVVYVCKKYAQYDFQSFILAVIAEEYEKGRFSRKADMREWLIDVGLIDSKLPKTLEGTEYYYMSDDGKLVKREEA